MRTWQHVMAVAERANLGQGCCGLPQISMRVLGNCSACSIGYFVQHALQRLILQANGLIQNPILLEDMI